MRLSSPQDKFDSIYNSIIHSPHSATGARYAPTSTLSWSTGYDRDLCIHDLVFTYVFSLLYLSQVVNIWWRSNRKPRSSASFIVSAVVEGQSCCCEDGCQHHTVGNTSCAAVFFATKRNLSCPAESVLLSCAPWTQGYQILKRVSPKSACLTHTISRKSILSHGLNIGWDSQVTGALVVRSCSTEYLELCHEFLTWRFVNPM